MTALRTFWFKLDGQNLTLTKLDGWLRFTYIRSIFDCRESIPEEEKLVYHCQFTTIHSFYKDLQEPEEKKKWYSISNHCIYIKIRVKFTQKKKIRVKLRKAIIFINICKMRLRSMNEIKS